MNRRRIFSRTDDDPGWRWRWAQQARDCANLVEEVAAHGGSISSGPALAPIEPNLREDRSVGDGQRFVALRAAGRRHDSGCPDTGIGPATVRVIRRTIPHACRLRLNCLRKNAYVPVMVCAEPHLSVSRQHKLQDAQKAVQQGRNERRGESYPWYGELSDARERRWRTFSSHPVRTSAKLPLIAANT